MVKIYGRNGCTSCNQAKTLCTIKGLEHKYLTLGVDYTLQEFVELTSGKHKTFPLIVVNDEIVGSFDSFKKMLGI